MKRNFPNWIKSYCEYTKHTEAPAHFHVWMGLFCIASVTARNLCIPMGAFDWVPNFYLIFVGEPGIVTKSTSIRLGQSLIARTGRVAIGPSSVTWQKLVREMKNRSVAQLETGETQASMTLCLSELGSFLDMENREQRDFLVDIWDSQRGDWVRSTLGGGEDKISNPCLNIVAATTPAWIRENFKQGAIGGGLSSRLVFVLGKSKRHLIAYPGLQPKAFDNEVAEKLVEDLIAISDLTGEMALTPDAIKWGEKWYRDHINKPDVRQLKGEKFSGYYARKQTHMHKLAMLLSLSTSNDLKVTAQHLQVAHNLLLTMERDYGEVLAFVQANTNYATVKITLLRLIRDAGQITRKALYREVSTMISSSDFDRMVSDLNKAGELRLIAKGSDTLLAPARIHGPACTDMHLQNSNATFVLGEGLSQPPQEKEDPPPEQSPSKTSPSE